MSPTPTSTWRVLDIELELGEPEELAAARAARSVGLDPARLRGARIARKALDARRRGGERRLRFVCSVDLVADADVRSAALQRAVRAGRVRPAPEVAALSGVPRHASWEGASEPVIVVGSGPGGLYAALALALNGIPVLVLERGPALAERGRHVVRFHRTRIPDPERNLLFGEGGAGTYSDGKIYTRVDDALEVALLEELVACGAEPQIVYDSQAHIGTDRLHRILPRFRARLEALGARFAFDTRLEGLVFGSSESDGGRVVRAVATTRGEMACRAVVLSIGHSARDTWRALAAQGVVLAAKPFQLGLRIEHPQELIDRGRLGGAVRELGPASYNLVAPAGERASGAHSFCMCPGGRIVASVSEAGLLCTNGMSNSRHSSAWASAAIVTTMGPAEFGSGAFDGVQFQAELERKAFEAGGSDYTAPAQTAADFLAGRASPSVRRSTFTFGTRPERLDRLLPERAVAAIAAALERFERQIPGFASDQGLFVGLETRSSGPVRMLRDTDSRRAQGCANLYPVGEGAGYAGGIMSAAIDGARSALALLAAGAPALARGGSA